MMKWIDPALHEIFLPPPCGGRWIAPSFLGASRHLLPQGEKEEKTRSSKRNSALRMPGDFSGQFKFEQNAYHR